MSYLAYKFRLYPNANQTRELQSQLETLRQVYNTALQYWRDLYETEKRSPKSSELYQAFSGVRNLQIQDQKEGGPGPHWLSRVSATEVRDVLKRVEKAFRNFFRRVKEKKGKPGYPRFKRYGGLSSIPFENYGAGCLLCGNRLKLFGVGLVKTKVHREVEGEVKTASVVRDVDGKWYVVLVAKQPDREVVPSQKPAAGVDVGLEFFLSTSDGEHESNPRYLEKELPKLRRMQRSASRKMEAAKKRKAKFRECKNLQKSFAEVARLHVRVRNLRKEHHHKVSTDLVDSYGTVCVESLNVKNMVRNGKLSRRIADAGWAGFVNILKCKAEKAGVRVVEVDPRGTSQECPKCGGGVKKTLSQRKHKCPHCGYRTHRDTAAAQMILNRGLGSKPPGTGVVGRNRKGSCAGARRNSVDP